MDIGAIFAGPVGILAGLGMLALGIVLVRTRTAPWNILGLMLSVGGLVTAGVTVYNMAKSGQKPAQ